MEKDQRRNRHQQQRQWTRRDREFSSYPQFIHDFVLQRTSNCAPPRFSLSFISPGRSGVEIRKILLFFLSLGEKKENRFQVRWDPRCFSFLIYGSVFFPLPPSPPPNSESRHLVLMCTSSDHPAISFVSFCLVCIRKKSQREREKEVEKIT